MKRNRSTLDGALNRFVSEHPDGWSHAEWEQLLRDLQAQDLDTTDRTAIGAALERERLLAELERLSVPGVGPKRREAIADRYGRLWELRQASPDQVAERSGIPRRVAENVVMAVRS